jgi:hypothetical protein
MRYRAIYVKEYPYEVEVESRHDVLSALEEDIDTPGEDYRLDRIEELQDGEWVDVTD